MKYNNIKIGTEKSLQKKITKEDTALNYGSGALKSLLASPSLAALMIEAAVTAVDPELPDEYITIGKFFQIDHINPTIEGMTVTVTAKIIEVENTKITFEIKALDELGIIGSGTHVRYIVNRERLLKKAEERCENLENLDR